MSKLYIELSAMKKYLHDMALSWERAAKAQALNLKFPEATSSQTRAFQTSDIERSLDHLAKPIEQLDDFPKPDDYAVATGKDVIMYLLEQADRCKELAASERDDYLRARQEAHREAIKVSLSLLKLQFPISYAAAKRPPATL